jgi:hypothetical protein
LDQEKLKGAMGGSMFLDRSCAVSRTLIGERALAETIRARPKKTARKAKCFILRSCAKTKQALCFLWLLFNFFQPMARVSETFVGVGKGEGEVEGDGER